jgi:hypothetical protein
VHATQQAAAFRVRVLGVVEGIVVAVHQLHMLDYGTMPAPKKGSASSSSLSDVAGQPRMIQCSRYRMQQTQVIVRLMKMHCIVQGVCILSDVVTAACGFTASC